MFTPQEIQEKTFVKAVFGGYDMQTVDDFLEPLTADYITLYKENAVLKSKMKVLVEKLEEYRAQEQSMRKAIISAQRTADAMVAEAEKKSAKIVNAAEQAATTTKVDTDALEKEAAEVIRQEKERENCAKKAALNFIDVLERDIRGHLELLEKLKQRDMTIDEEAERQPKRAKPFDFEAAERPAVKPQAEEMPLVVPKAAAEPEPEEVPEEPEEEMLPPLPEEKAETTEEIANEIEHSITRLMNLEEPVKEDNMESTIKFTNLQFGRNYDPTSK